MTRPRTAYVACLKALSVLLTGPMICLCVAFCCPLICSADEADSRERSAETKSPEGAVERSSRWYVVPVTAYDSDVTVQVFIHTSPEPTKIAG